MPNDEAGVKHFILATAGHVDHGKTALVQALTGVDTDRLPEEKARGITIDLGFAHLALPAPLSTLNSELSTLSIGVIDVPGHEDFIRNMIAGLGAIDLALLVVAADDGWMPQTEEHFQILNYLGVRQGVAAITKCDLGDPARIAADVRERLRGTSLGEMPIVQTSARGATGLDELKQILARVSASISPPRDSGKPRLFVDRVFTVRGSGTVVTGTLTGGRLSRGETILLQPQNLCARIRAIQSHNQSLEVAFPGTRTALNLPDLRPGEVPRGSVLTTIDSAESSRAIDAMVERSARAFLPSRPLKNASVVQVHYGSARFTARILWLDRRELLPGETAIARLRFAKPAFVFAGDRFIIRDSSGRQTIAGGVVLNPDAEGTRFRASAERRFLQARAASPNNLVTLLGTQLQRDQFVRRAALLLQSSFSEEEITNAVDRLADEKKVFTSGTIVADAAWWEALRQRAIDAIDTEHAVHPERAGLDLAQLRAHLSLADAELENALIAADLAEKDFSCAQGAIKRRNHQPSLPAVLEGAGEKIRAALAARPFDPPSRKELIVDAAAQQALRFLSETGEVIPLNDDVLLSADAFAQMKSRIAQALRASGPATVSELRQMLGTTRRVLVPLLECCDRAGLTSRQGDRRTLRSPKA
jgi:selenocysteine-specific elongation factor